MKWGVRKDGRPQGYKSTGTRSTKKTTRSTSKVSAALANRSAAKVAKKNAKAAERQAAQERRNDAKLSRLRTMSDADLKGKIERLKNEKQLRDLTYESETSKTRQLARSVGEKTLKMTVAAAAGVLTAVAIEGINRKIQNDSVSKLASSGASLEEIKRKTGYSESIIQDVVDRNGELFKVADYSAAFTDIATAIKNQTKKAK